MRRLLLAWHRAFGIAAAIWLLLLAASGSIIVFQDEIDRWLNADLFSATAGPAASIDLFVSAAEAQRPGHFASFVEL
ncbi:MAG: PepSY domain-containing protein, partial [Rubrimonas sp.]